MKFYHLVLLMAIVLLASVDSASTFRLTTPGAHTQVLEKDTPTKRFLRAYADDEERAIPGLEKVVKAFTSSKTKELKGLLKADESIGDAFKTLGINKIPIGKGDFIETKMVAKLFSSTNFKVWSQHATRLSKQDPEGAMLASLTNVFGEKNVATMILLGKDSRSSRQVAKKLEAAQFNKWFSVDKFNADNVLEKVMLVKRKDIHANSRAKFVWGNYDKYYHARVMNY